MEATSSPQMLHSSLTQFHPIPCPGRPYSWEGLTYCLHWGFALPRVGTHSSADAVNVLYSMFMMSGSGKVCKRCSAPVIQTHWIGLFVCSWSKVDFLQVFCLVLPPYLFLTNPNGLGMGGMSVLPVLLLQKVL